MAIPTLTPTSSISAVRLPATGTHTDVTLANLPFGVYAIDGALFDANFVSGAVDQVAHTYRKLGGDVLDIELKEQNVYAAYEESVLEYSYIINTHQAKNILSNVLGGSTGSFDQFGELVSGTSLSSSLSGTNVALKYPKFKFGYAERVGEGTATAVGLGGSTTIYSASFNTTASRQDYDLQKIVSSSSDTDSDLEYYGKVGNKKILIKKVYYKTPHSMWRFYGYYGGLNTVGNLHQYGQFADDSNFELVPAWHNKMQAMGFEDNLWTRTSHFSYEVKNNNLRLFPEVTDTHPTKMWIEFTVQSDAWEEDSDRLAGTEGINNMNTLPFANIRFVHINAIGKQWIRRFALALTKEMLGQVRGKFSTIPIPGESVTLNAAELISQAKEEQSKLREELKITLDDMTYAKLAETEASIMDNSNKVQSTVPAGIFVG